MIPAMTGQHAGHAPWPEALASVVALVTYKPGWAVTLRHITDTERSGLALIVTSSNPDSYGERPGIRVAHEFMVPLAVYDEPTWRRWLFDRILDAERHESMEFFKVDGRRLFAPHHGDGRDPYAIHDRDRCDDAEEARRLTRGALPNEAV